MRIIDKIVGSRRRVEIQKVPSNCEVVLYLWDGMRIVVEQEMGGAGSDVSITVRSREPIPVYDVNGDELCTIPVLEEGESND